MNHHKFHPSILREYDIRGIYKETLSEEDAYAIGRCFGKIVKEQLSDDRLVTVVVGRDGRHSSQPLEEALIKGIIEEGLNVIKVGLCPTPLVYYATKIFEESLNVQGGIMITGSHNPINYNGFKMLLKDRPIYGDDIRRFADLALNLSQSYHLGGVMEQDLKPDYVQRIFKDYDSPRPLKVVWDIGNGVVGTVIHDLIKLLPGEHILLFDIVDGSFPHHHPDPTQPENLHDIIEAVKLHKADMGLAFDGDGDRLGAVDNKGNIFYGEELLMVFARDVLKKLPGSTVISDVKTSQALFNEITQLGGHPVMGPTGHSLIKILMSQTKAPLAGEMSGHIFFADTYYGYDDALYAAIRLINIVGRQNKPFSDIYASLPKLFNTPELRFVCDDALKFGIVEKILQELKKVKDLDISTLDGIRVNTTQGWWLLRASNTQNVLVCRCESETKKGLEEMKKMLVKLLKPFDLEMPKELSINR